MTIETPKNEYILNDLRFLIDGWKNINSQKELQKGMTIKLLIYGIGNLGRNDDGLGPKVLTSLEEFNWSDSIQLQCNYQLNIEDALELSNFDLVLFIDAKKIHMGSEVLSTNKDYSIEKINGTKDISFSTHAMSFGAVVGLCEELYQKKPEADLITIPGYSWEICEELSPRALIHYQRTLEDLIQILHCISQMSNSSKLENISKQINAI